MGSSEPIGAHTDDDAEGAAEQATQRLNARPRTKDWNETRQVVLIEVLRHQEQKQCLLDLESLRTESLVTLQDWKAPTFY
jgi:hypothetical protein